MFIAPKKFLALPDSTQWHAFSNPRTPYRTILYYPLKNLAIPG
jgi:hypothetical protein